MPLILAVLIVLVLVFNLSDWRSNKARQAAINEKNRRKTNAKLEHKILDNYMKHGYSFDDAFRKSYEDMISAGYDQCIPRDAYKNREGVESSSCGVYGGSDVERYDSLWVKQRREEAKRDWLQAHPGMHISKASTDEIDALIYSNFPQTELQYLCDIQRSSVKASAEPVGSCIIYPGLGTCEVLAHNWTGNGNGGGTYTLKVLKTGEIVTYVKIGDDKIRRQGQ